MTNLKELIMLGGLSLGITTAINAKTVEEFNVGYGTMLASGISAVVYIQKKETREDRLRYESQWRSLMLK